jgi:hypothetical protein
MSEDDECAVCLQETSNRLQPCKHAVCGTCIDTWVAKHHMTCPMCRGVLTGTGRAPDTSKSLLQIVLKNGAHAGVTLVNDAMSGGVRVRRLVLCDRAYRAGLRPGDVITHLNDLPVQRHADAVAIVNRATQVQEDVIVTVHRQRRPWWWRMCF